MVPVLFSFHVPRYHGTFSEYPGWNMGVALAVAISLIVFSGCLDYVLEFRYLNVYDLQQFIV